MTNQIEPKIKLGNWQTVLRNLVEYSIEKEKENVKKS